MYLNRSPLYFLILDVGKYVKTNFFLSFAELVLMGNRSIYGGGVSFFFFFFFFCTQVAT